MTTNVNADLLAARAVAQALTLEDVLKSYSGRTGCACGCRGNYRTTKAARAEADKDRGYTHEDDEVRDASVKRVLGEVVRLALTDGVTVELGKGFQYVWCEMDGKVRAVYLTAAARAKLAAGVAVGA